MHLHTTRTTYTDTQHRHTRNTECRESIPRATVDDDDDDYDHDGDDAPTHHRVHNMPYVYIDICMYRRMGTSRARVQLWRTGRLAPAVRRDGA